MQDDAHTDDDEPDMPPPAELAQAGAVIDRAIAYMMEQKVGSLSIASALLGGALGVLSRSMSDEGIIAILDNAIDSVNAGELREMVQTDPAAGEEPGGEPSASR